MKKKITISTAISIIFVAMTITFCLTMIISARLFESKVESVSEKEAMYDKIAEIDQVVRQNFYTTVDDGSVFESLSDGYVNGLKDSDSRYYTSREVTMYQQQLEGKMIGIGADIAKSRENGGYMQVYNVYTDSPADVQGIVAQDLITAINGVSTINMSVESAKRMLEGLTGSTVDITYTHENAETTVTLTRRAYDAPTVTYSKEGDSGYIKISSFSQRTASELEYAANNLIGQGATSLILDVRDNSGKNFDYAAQAADVLLKEGTTMYAVYKDGERKVLFTSDKTSVSVPIVMLVNSRTGYAAEMFTVMFKDMASSRIVGTTTMGRGTYQKMFRMSDGSGVELSVAVLSPVTTASYNGTGIAPDYEKVLESYQEQSYYTMAPSEDPQVQRALEVAKNRTATNQQ